MFDRGEIMGWCFLIMGLASCTDSIPCVFFLPAVLLRLFAPRFSKAPANGNLFMGYSTGIFRLILKYPYSIILLPILIPNSSIIYDLRFFFPDHQMSEKFKTHTMTTQWNAPRSNSTLNSFDSSQINFFQMWPPWENIETWQGNGEPGSTW